MSKITLNVGGKTIMVDKSTIEQLDYFKSKLERWSTEGSSNQSDIFVDCDPKLFRHVLNFITIPNCRVPDKYVYNVQMLLDFYSPKKFTIKTKDIVRKSILTNRRFLEFKSYDPDFKQNSEISFEHDGIVRFYCKIISRENDRLYSMCYRVDNPLFKLELWDTHNLIEFVNEKNESNIIQYQTTDKDDKYTKIFNIPDSIMIIFKKKLHVKFTPILNAHNEKMECCIDVTHFKKK